MAYVTRQRNNLSAASQMPRPTARTACLTKPFMPRSRCNRVFRVIYSRPGTYSQINFNTIFRGYNRITPADFEVVVRRGVTINDGIFIPSTIPRGSRINIVFFGAMSIGKGGSTYSSASPAYVRIWRHVNSPSISAGGTTFVFTVLGQV
jgi:hypothetical protein